MPNLSTFPKRCNKQLLQRSIRIFARRLASSFQRGTRVRRGLRPGWSKPIVNPARIKAKTLSVGRKLSDALGITNDLPFGAEKEQYLHDLRSLKDDRKFVFTHFYTNLDILDNKTNSLIQFSSILTAIYIAIVGFVAQSIKVNFSTAAVFWGDVAWSGLTIGWTLTVGALFSFLASVVLLLVEYVHWSSPRDLSDEAGHSLHLLEIRNKRTIRYRIGWQLSMFSLLLLALNVYLVARSI
jgi:hypothetical protein